MDVFHIGPGADPLERLCLHGGEDAFLTVEIRLARRAAVRLQAVKAERELVLDDRLVQVE